MDVDVEVQTADNDEDDSIAEPEEGEEAEDGEDVVPVKRGRGRPRGSKNRTVGTPRGRGRGRGRGRSRGRGITIKLPKRSGEDVDQGEESAPVEAETPVPVEEVPVVEAGEGPVGGGKPFRRINGQVYIIEDDEYVIEDDPKGDAKVDQYGNLLGDRKFKAQTFQLPNRHPDRMYMLAIDAARTSGFRDSLYYFRRNPLAMKLSATQAEKEYLIEVGKLGSHLRTRSVTMITARSAYKLHGAKMVQAGKWVIDDYYEDKALEECTAKGLKPGDPVDEPQDTTAAAPEATTNKTERIGSGLGMYRAGGPTTIFGGSGWGPYSDGPLNAVRKSLLTRDGLNEENWMYIAAQRTMDASREWANLRAEAMKVCGGILDDGASQQQSGESKDRDGVKRRKVWDEDEPMPVGVYEPHTANVLYRSDTQSTRARWEPIDDGQRVLGGTKAGSQAWGLAWVDTAMEMPRPEEIDEDNARLRAPFLQGVDQPP
ncbi:hypothetical protein DAEQUDRAFT_731708 [Daedalea quercina L-15889]|uniref:Chromatin remodelling complex Rsc7/Swp82 subunit n=1 Tax=Daedalea quercina L-15889 TaxID=1314783 RepID=A0A165M3L3_9APHY|nr:hypothetical protein DAEQUDRAFT_731708 [Daedalea quercina L-15889]